MACIKSASRSASLAFSPDAPYLAAGTMAGAVDLSFSSSANLDIFKLDFQSPDPTLPVVAECPSTERFNRLSWGKTGSGTQEFSMGLIAGGLVDGTINIWNPLTLINMGDSVQALVGRLQKHMGPVRGLEFNVNQPNLLASGADEGELCIWDLSKPLEPSHFPPLKGVGSGAQGEVSFLSWNPKVQHILASTSYNGTTVVWDLKRQKPVLSLSDSNRKRSSVLQWNPDISTQLIVASDDDTSPTLRVWDMRNTISPLKEFVGHTKGVIAMSWCPNDSAFLLTCAKDNRTICWDTSSGEIVCELPARTNWNFDIHWYPKIPGVISASSFDGKIGIYNIEACSRLASGDGDFPGAFSASGTSVHLRAPKWLKRSSGVSFGFGGRLVTFGPSSAGGASPSCSEVYLHTVVTEQSLVTRSAEFESSIRNREKSALRDLCDKKSQESISEDDRETWGFLKVMFDEDGNARTKLLTHLGFNVPTEVDNAVLQDIANVNLDENNKADFLAEKEENVFSLDNGEEFFNNLESPKADRSPAPSGETLVAEVDSSVNGVDIQKKSDAVSSNDTSFELDVQNALVVGNYKGAVLQCISSKRMADALVIAHMGGTSLWNETRDQYLKMCHTSYLKIVAAMVNNDLMSLVNTRPLSSWKETLALLCTFAQREEWTLLCETLASRLMVVGNTLAATLCYICAGNVDKPVEIWVRTLKAEDDGKTYVDHLQDIMERTVILALAVEQKRFSASLSKLVEIYAELLSSQGLLATAMEYLELLGSEHNPPELQILRDRISFSVEVTGTPKTLLSENAQTRTDTTYGAEHSSQDAVDGSQHYYQLQPNVTSSSYSESGYQQPFSATATYGTAYQPAPPKQFQEFLTPTTFQPQQPQIFLPSQTPQIPQASIVPPPPVTMQQPVRSFVPAPPPVLRNVEPYQQPTLGSQLYPGSVGLASSHAAGPPPVGQVPAHHKMTHVAATSPTPMGFTPVTNLGYAQRPAPIVQPTSPTHSMQQSHPVTPAPPTVQTADTSKVSAELKPIVATLTRLFNETSEALGGGRANPAKKREIEDNSKKIGSLFAKLNSGDISPNAASKLTQLCQALDAGDFASALHLQVVLTTSDWDECNLWLAALKRMIKTRQNIRLN